MILGETECVCGTLGLARVKESARIPSYIVVSEGSIISVWDGVVSTIMNFLASFC